MAQLEKFIKVTQEQYNTLQAGGTVGSHTGINPNFIYLVENTDSHTLRWSETETLSFTIAEYDQGYIFSDFEDFGSYTATLNNPYSVDAEVWINFRNVDNCRFLLTLGATKTDSAWRIGFNGKMLGAINVITTEGNYSLGNDIYFEALGHSFYENSFSFYLNHDGDIIPNGDTGFVLVNVVNGVANITVSNLPHEV